MLASPRAGRRRPSASRLLPALAIFGLGASACGEPPSFRAEWKIAPSYDQMADAIRPESIAACTATGIGGVRIETTQEGLSIDSRTFDCYEGGSVDGPTLPPGVYDVDIIGLRRNGESWVCELDETYIGQVDCQPGSLDCACADGGQCDAGLSCTSQFSQGDEGSVVEDRWCVPCIARTSQRIEIVAEATEALDFTLIAPPECDDGIDNDRDGLTDRLDPACARDPESREDQDAVESTIALEISFLDGNPNVACTSATESLPARFPLGVRRVTLELRDASDALLETWTVACDRFLPIRNFDLPAGEYSVGVVGRGPAPTDPDQDTLENTALTQFKTLPLVANEAAGGFLMGRVDFSGDDFLAPITGTISFAPNYDLDGPEKGDFDRLTCGPVVGATNNISPLVVDTLDITVTDAEGNLIDPGTLSFEGGVANGDAVRLPCLDSSGTPQPPPSLPVDWGSYLVSVAASANGVICFESRDPEFVSPVERVFVNVQRVLVDGVPPSGCEDCLSNDDCPSVAAPECIDGLCRPMGG